MKPKDTIEGWIVHHLIHRFAAGILRIMRSLWAKSRGKAFYCRALAGKSNYNISVNSDLTVSCNCQDRDNAAVIGSLRDNTLREIFGGKLAQKLRTKLASGWLPLSWCVHCSDWREVPRGAAQRQLFEYDIPKQGLAVELANACNLACNSCYRVTMDQVRTKKFILGSDVDKVAKEVAGVKLISLFKLGEPFLYPNLGGAIDTFRKYNPD